MRLYSFVNYYLSPLQHGLQTAHCVGDILTKYRRFADMDPANQNNLELAAKAEEWAEYHKTIIICNGGNSLSLSDLYSTLTEYEAKFKLPIVRFYEDEQSLNGALTSVAIVVPAQFYDVVHKTEPNGDGEMNAFYRHVAITGGIVDWFAGSDEYNFISLLKSFRLA